MIRQILIIISLFHIIPVFSQNYFESLPFPDSTFIKGLDVDQSGNIYVSANSEYAHSKTGVYKSVDGGQIWEFIYPISNQLRSLIIDSKDSIYLLLQSSYNEQGIKKSSDYGQTWVDIPVPGNTYTSNDELFLQGDDTLYVAQNFSQGVSLIRSVDFGLNWDTLFTTSNHPSETISSLAVLNNQIYIGLTGFFEGMGGVYKSTDYGTTWELAGLFSNRIRGLSFNSTGTLFISSMGGNNPGGLYAIFPGDNFITPLCMGISLTDIEINSSDDIFAGCSSVCRVFHSSDNGNTFDFLYSGLPPIYTGIWEIFLDNEQFIYTILELSHGLWRSAESTITATNGVALPALHVFPNPSADRLYGSLNHIENGKINYKLLDTIGRVVKHGTVTIKNYQFSIDLSDISIGSYILHFNDSIYNKIIKI